MIAKVNLNYKNIYYWLIAAALFLAALGLRLAYLGYSTLYHGEAEAGQEIAYVLPCLQELTFLEAMWRLWHLYPVQLNPMFTLLPIRIPIAWFFGITEFNLRLHSAVAGVISCLLIFWLVRRHADRKTALIALALIAFNPFIIIFNRYTFQESIQITFMLAGLLFIDLYTGKRRKNFLLLCSFCFALSFLIKPNAVIFIFGILLMYHLFLGLRIIEIVAVFGSIVGIIICLFIDQLPTLFSTFAYTLSWVSSGIKSSSTVKIMLSFAKAYLTYFELIIFPLLVCMVFLKKIENKYFKVLLFFSIFYFIALCFQGRSFHRYLHIGIIMTSASFAYPLSEYANKSHSYKGVVFLVLYIIWGLFSHGTYISSQYHHIPYKYIKERAYEASSSGDILLYGRNSETEYYLSPTRNLLFDETLNPCEETTLLRSEFPEWADAVRKIPPTREMLLDTTVVHSGDIVVVTGMQMHTGEPTPYWHGYDGKGFRVYRHDLRLPNKFYKDYMSDHELQKLFEIKEKIFLTNNSNELAALILKKI